MEYFKIKKDVKVDPTAQTGVTSGEYRPKVVLPTISKEQRERDKRRTLETWEKNRNQVK